MNKRQFLKKLSTLLGALPRAEREKALHFYEEIIDDRMEAGEQETDVLEDLGDVKQLAEKILAENPATRRISAAAKAWMIVALVLGSPIWLSLGLTVVTLLFSLYLVVWTLLACFYLVALALFACLIAGVFSSFLFIGENPLAALFQMGAGLLCGGLGIFLLVGTILLTRQVIRATKYLCGKMGRFWRRKVVRRHA